MITFLIILPIVIVLTNETLHTKETEIETEIDELLILLDDNNICTKLDTIAHIPTANDTTQYDDVEIELRMFGGDGETCEVCCSNPAVKHVNDETFLEFPSNCNLNCDKECDTIEQRIFTNNIINDTVNCSTLTKNENLLNEIINQTFFNNGKLNKFDCLLQIMSKTQFIDKQLEISVLRNFITHFLEYESLLANDVFDTIDHYFNIFEYIINKLVFLIDAQLHQLLVDLKFHHLQHYVLKQIDFQPSLFEIIVTKIFDYDFQLCKEILHNYLINKITSKNALFHVFNDLNHARIKFIMLKRLWTMLSDYPLSEFTLNLGIIMKSLDRVEELAVEDQKWLVEQTQQLPNCIKNLLFAKYVCLRIPVENLFSYVYYNESGYLFMSEPMIHPPENSTLGTSIKLHDHDQHSVVFTHPILTNLTFRFVDLLATNKLYLSEVLSDEFGLDRTIRFHMFPHATNFCAIYWSSYFLQADTDYIFGEFFDKFRFYKITLWDIIDCTKFLK